MARYSEKIVERIVSLIEDGNYTVATICKIVGIGRRTFYEWRAARPEFGRQLSEAEEWRMDELRVIAHRVIRQSMEDYTQIIKRTVYVPAANDASQMIVKQQVVTEKQCRPDMRLLLQLLDRSQKKSMDVSANVTPQAATIIVASDEAKVKTKTDLETIPQATTKTEPPNKELPNEESPTESDNELSNGSTTAEVISESEPKPIAEKPLPLTRAEIVAERQQRLEAEYARNRVQFVPPPLRGIPYRSRT